MNGNNGIISALVGGVEEVGDALEAIGDVFQFLLSPQGWLRIFYVLAGVLLLFGALRYGHH